MENVDILFFVGPPRTASTWLHNVLSEKDGFCLPSSKQPKISLLLKDITFSQYMATFSDHSDGDKLVDINPEYCLSENFFINKSRFFPDSEIVFLLRNPSDRLESHLNLVKNSNINSSKKFLLNRLSKYSQYTSFIELAMKYMNHNKIHVISFNILNDHPQRFFNIISSILGVKPTLNAEKKLKAKIGSVSSRGRLGYLIASLGVRLSSYSWLEIIIRKIKSSKFIVKNLTRILDLTRYGSISVPGNIKEMLDSDYIDFLEILKSTEVNFYEN